MDGYDAGEDIEALAADYRLNAAQIEDAVLYDRGRLSRVYFTDRNLGRRIFPGMPWKSAGLTVVRHDDVFDRSHHARFRVAPQGRRLTPPASTLHPARAPSATPSTVGLWLTKLSFPAHAGTKATALNLS